MMQRLISEDKYLNALADRFNQKIHLLRENAKRHTLPDRDSGIPARCDDAPGDASLNRGFFDCIGDFPETGGTTYCGKARR
jgi:hypothetical protein